MSVFVCQRLWLGAAVVQIGRNLIKMTGFDQEGIFVAYSGRSLSLFWVFTCGKDYHDIEERERKRGCLTNWARARMKEQPNILWHGGKGHYQNMAFCWTFEENPWLFSTASKEMWVLFWRGGYVWLLIILLGICLKCFYTCFLDIDQKFESWWVFCRIFEKGKILGVTCPFRAFTLLQPFKN